MNYKQIFLIIIIICQFACHNESGNQEINNSNSIQNHFEDSETRPDESETVKKESDINNDDDVDKEEKSSELNSDDSDEEIDNSKCKFKDDTYSASVEYYNPETGYTQTYTLEVEVEDCEVVQIDFPKGGWLDKDHISSAELDKHGNAVVEGENGKTYTIHIEK